MALYDFAHYLYNPRFSDIDILIIVRNAHQLNAGGGRSGSKRSRDEDDQQQPAVTLPRHRSLLHQASPVFAAQLDRRQQDAAGNAPTGKVTGHATALSQRSSTSHPPNKPNN